MRLGAKLMRIKLDKCWADYLASQPEDGMGWQRVRIVFDDGAALEDVVVLNAEEADVPDAWARRKIVQLIKPSAR